MVAQSNSGFPNDNDQVLPEGYSTPSWAQTRRKKRPLRTVLVAGGLIGSLLIACLCSVIGILTLTLVSAVESQDEWLALSDAYMQAMADKEVEKAYILFTKETRRTFSLSDLATYVDGPRYVLFEGYVNLQMETFFVNYVYPEGITAEVTGLVNYRDGHTGVFEFHMTEEEETWRLLDFNVETSPEEVNSYSDMQP